MLPARSLHLLEHRRSLEQVLSCVHMTGSLKLLMPQNSTKRLIPVSVKQ